MEGSLFSGKLIALAAPDAEQDAAAMARWTEDAEYLHLAAIEPPRPFSAGAVKKLIQSRTGKEDAHRFDFSIRRMEDSFLVGSAAIYGVDWVHGAAWLEVAIPEAVQRGHGYGTEALHLLLRYAFRELNLHRLACRVFEYNLTALHFLQKAGFQIEVRQREAILRQERRWSALLLGLLRDEWLAGQTETGVNP